MKEEKKNTTESIDEKGLKGFVKRHFGFCLVLFVLLLHFMTMLSGFYGSNLMFFLWIFEIGFISAVVTKNGLKGWIVSFVMSVFLPFLSLAHIGLWIMLPTMTHKPFIFWGIVLSSVLIGKLVKYKFPRRVFLSGVVLFSLIHLFGVGYLAAMRENCQFIDDQYSEQKCYRYKAERNEDENICANIDSKTERDVCYYYVLFDYDGVSAESENDNENYVSVSQCDGIIDGADRERCYAFFAGVKVDKSICDNLIEDDEIRDDCYRRIEEDSCYRLPARSRLRDYCQAELREFERSKDKRFSELFRTDTLDAMKNGLAVEYREYKKMVQSEKEGNNDPVLQSKKKRLVDISEIQGTAIEAIQYVKRCDKGGSIVKDGYPSDIMCEKTVTWLPLSVCGEGQTDAKWVIKYKGEEWDYTVECKNYPECSGIDNLRCIKDGCFFSEKCNGLIQGFLN